jgi:crotonobetainyl-CoA:carnitine CoA-transferase CaiB-like acyl-CoA transferase
MQPLAGVMVLDFTTLLPGPLATLMLAEAGAEVIKIEPPGGDMLRTHPPHVDGHSAAFAALNHGKTMLTLDLKAQADRDRLKPLLARADVLVEQFRPGVMKRLGLGYDSVRAINPSVVYCSISGYGQSGPRAQEAGHDLNYIGTTGLLALNPGPPDRPTVPPALIADIGGGTFPAVLNILLGLRQRETSGVGCHLDIAMADAMFTFAWHALLSGAAGQGFPAMGEDHLSGGSPRYRLYPTRDGQIVACAALEPKFWEAFTKAIELAPRFVNDADDRHATAEAVAALIKERTAEQWRPIFAAADCCATIVRSLEEAMRDPQFVGRGLFARECKVGEACIPALPLPIAPGFRQN